VRIPALIRAMIRLVSDTDTTPSPTAPPLKRTLSLTLTTLYGLGTILGAGIYSLIGEVAGSAGMYVPVAFLVAALVAGLTGLSYAELAARFPRSAGEAVYVQEGLGWPPLSTLVGLLIALTGTVSCATLANAFVGYAHKLIALFTLPGFIEQAWYLDRLTIIVITIGVIGALAAWGIRQSVLAASAVTVVEIGGLLLILVVSSDSLASAPARIAELLPPLRPAAWNGILVGAFLAFYAFIGFEDMVNIAEEVKEPQRNLPRAIILAVIVSMLLYMLVALSAVLALSPEQLSHSQAPMAQLYQRATGRTPWVITLISLFAVINGALIQIIMASRMLYGISREGWLPAFASRVHPRTRTPLVATAIVAVCVLVLAVPLNIRVLADTTSFIILIVYILVNLSLLRIKRQAPTAAGVRPLPLWVPVIALIASAGFVAMKLSELAG
jgi:APA family basic amino acid/polyamine antiporter